ncbi:MAG: hypothetical protein E6G60_22360 [Actinobacteria bacterium]|nr:MAG: hypothetical protein E6G60_22360 [Actinomycetota bacterium]
MPPATKKEEVRDSKIKDMLKDSGSDLTASLRGYAGLVRSLPSTVRKPADLVDRYYGVRSESLTRAHKRALKFAESAPKPRLPKLRSSKSEESTAKAS